MQVSRIKITSSGTQNFEKLYYGPGSCQVRNVMAKFRKALRLAEPTLIVSTGVYR